MVHEQWSARINSELNNIYFIIWALKFRPYILIQYLFGLRHIQNCKAHRRDSWVQSYYKLSNNFIKQAGDISYLECNIHKFDCPNIFSLNRTHTHTFERYFLTGSPTNLIWYAEYWWLQINVLYLHLHHPSFEYVLISEYSSRTDYPICRHCTSSIDCFDQRQPIANSKVGGPCRPLLIAARDPLPPALHTRRPAWPVGTART